MWIYKPGSHKKYNPDKGEGQKPPAKPGEYRIKDEDGNILYIGEACNLERRMKQHIKSGKIKLDWGESRYGIYIWV